MINENKKLMTLISVSDFYDYKVEFANNNVQLINCADEVFVYDTVDDALLSWEFVLEYEQQKIDMFEDGRNLWRNEIKFLKEVKNSKQIVCPCCNQDLKEHGSISKRYKKETVKYYSIVDGEVKEDETGVFDYELEYVCVNCGESVEDIINNL